jgi:hypothetical protein
VEELLLSAIERTGGGGARQTEMHTAQPFVPEPNIAETEVPTGKLKMYMLPCVNQIRAEVIQVGGETLHSEIR